MQAGQQTYMKFSIEVTVGFKNKCIKDNILLMIVSSKSTLLIILLEVHGITHSGNNSPFWFAQSVRAGCPYSDYRVQSFLVGLELPVL